LSGIGSGQQPVSLAQQVCGLGSICLISSEVTFVMPLMKRTGAEVSPRAARQLIACAILRAKPLVTEPIRLFRETGSMTAARTGIRDCRFELSKI
jgi:hypothetical protein